jgi:glycosyltransferase involved in cell wall biosynthesis
MDIKATVIIPAYIKDQQDLDWLHEAVDSVFAQTIKCKLIIVENGSNKIDKGFDNIDVIRSDKGLSKARNAGIKACDTEFFFPLDANDWLPPNAIEIAVKNMPAKGFLYGSTMLFTGERGNGDQHLYRAKPYDFQEIMKAVYFPNGALQRKSDWEKIGGYREDLTMLEDWDYWMTAGEKGICGTSIQNVLYWYRQHNGIVGSNKHTKEWEDAKKLIQSFHSDIYKGVYPSMCCGNKAKEAVAYTPPQRAALTPGVDGMLLVEYTGGNVGKMPYYGAVTNIRYVVSGIQRQFYIDVRDAITGSNKTPGFLEMTDHGTPMFKEVKE